MLDLLPFKVGEGWPSLLDYDSQNQGLRLPDFNTQNGNCHTIYSSTTETTIVGVGLGARFGIILYHVSNSSGTTSDERMGGG